MPATPQARAWTTSITLFAAVLIPTFAVYADTAASFARIWARSETFAYGFLIVPTSAYLIWLQRRALATLSPRPFPLAILLLPPLGVAWMAGYATSTVLVEELSFIGMVLSLVLALFGPRVVRTIAFPLGFLLFCVPFGDVLRPSLMDLTASIAVGALRLSGVPVARQGVFLAIPTGMWRIAEACSGLQFLASGFVLTCLFAYATFRGAWKRILCVGLSVVVLVLANGFRAYSLILIGYLSDMRLGRGLEHRTLGYVVYALALLAYFAICSRYRDRTLSDEVTPAAPGRGEAGLARPSTWLAVGGASLLALGIWPALYDSLSRGGTTVPAAPISAPAPRAGWALDSTPGPDWRPPFAGASSDTVQAYVKDGATVRCYIAFYGRQGTGRKLIQFGNVIAHTDDLHWRNVGERDRRLRFGGRDLVVRETDVLGQDARLLVWHWYWLPDEFTNTGVGAKLLQARDAILLHRDHAAVVVLFASSADVRDPTADLQRFAGDMLPSIQLALRRADGSL